MILDYDELKKKYPYRFQLQITYTLKGATITTSYRVFNRNSVSMPYFIGGHPGFRCPLLPDEQFEDYVIEFEKPETAACPESVPATGLINMSNRVHDLENRARHVFQEKSLGIIVLRRIT